MKFSELKILMGWHTILDTPENDNLDAGIVRDEIRKFILKDLEANKK